MPLWSQGEAREGEAVNPEGERWKGESEAVPPPKRVVMAKSSMVASTIPKSPIYHGNRDASQSNQEDGVKSSLKGIDNLYSRDKLISRRR
jgi:hypothetical protein